MSKLVYVHSKHRSSGSKNNFVVNLPSTTLVGHYVISSISFPNLAYNIDANTSVYRYSIGGVPGSFSIPQGQYTWASFVVAFEAAWVANIGGTVSLTLNPLTNKASILSSVATAYTIENNYMANILGLDIGSGGVDVPIMIFNNSPWLGGLTNLFIQSRTLCDGWGMMNSENENLPVFSVVPVNVEYGAMQHYLPEEVTTNRKIFRNGSKSLQSIDIKLTDHHGNLIDINGEFNLILKVYPPSDNQLL